DDLEGMQLSNALPFAGVTVAVGSVASVGLRGISGFVVELQVLIGAWRSFPTMAVCDGIETVDCVAYTLRVLQKAFCGALAALVVLFIDLGIMRPAEGKFRRMVAALVTGVSCLVAIFWMHQVRQETGPGFLSGMLVVDLLTQWVKQGVLVLTLFTAWVSIDSTFTDHTGEYFALLLLATVGMMFLVSAENLLMIFISLELLSLSLYILTAFNKRNLRSAEAALKYFLFGGMAAAFTLFGLSLLYGLTGSIELRPIAAALKGKGLDPALAAAIVMTVIGFGFKIAAVPFHLWAPDAYEGAPTPSAALIASGSKVASFFILA